MKYKTHLLIAICLGFIFIWQSSLMATPQEKQTIPPLAVFSNQTRPAATFSHDLHEEKLGETGCAKCHHILDEEQNKLVYSEGDEAACTECHQAETKDRVLSNRDANHASCTACHRALIKEKKPSGPTTCGECHKK